MRRHVALLAALILLLLAGCARSQARPYVRLADLDPTLAAGAQGISPRPVLRVGLSTGMSPREAFLRYGPLLDHLGRRLKRPVEVVLPRSNTEAIDLVRSGGVHVAFVGSYAYVRGQKEFGMEALAVPVYAGQPTRRSYILVRRYSGVTRFADLKGHSFAYTDPLSATGRLYPEAMILQLRESADRFFEHTIFASSDDRAIQSLDQGLVDGAAVDSAMYDIAVLKDPDLARRLRIVEESEPFGAPPIVVSPRLGSELKRMVQEVLLQLEESQEGRAVLAGLILDRFVTPDLASYESVANLAARVGVSP